MKEKEDGRSGQGTKEGKGGKGSTQKAEPTRKTETKKAQAKK